MQQVWLDQGGTFTDLILYRSDGTIEVKKVLSSDHSTIAELTDGVSSRRGTTVATNALLERKGVRTVLITNSGFGDLRFIGDQRREELFDITGQRSPPLGEVVLEIEGRISASGEVLRPAVLPEERALRLLQNGISCAAVVLVHGPLVPTEEAKIARRLLEMGFQHVSVGHEVSPKVGFIVRLQSTLADACLSPLLPREAGLYMKSNGGLARNTDSDWRGINAVLSGPAGGAVAVEHLVAKLGIGKAFGLDLGGTSADVCHVCPEVGRVDRLVVNHWPLQVPSIRIETVAAGGGSILRSQAGLFRVGPESAGSDPGPACYGRGGPATLTDCEAVLGRLISFPNICGPSRDQPLDTEAAQRQVQALDPESKIEDIALWCKSVAVEEMSSAILKHAANLGVDPADHALVVFGGAGGAHACDIAKRLEIETVVVPGLAGVFSAVGIGMANRRVEFSRAVIRGDLQGAIEDLLRCCSPSSSVEWTFDVRYAGTSSSIQVSSNSTRPSREEVEAGFIREHRSVFGFEREHPIEIPSITLVETQMYSAQISSIPETLIERKHAEVYVDDRWQKVPVLPFQDITVIQGPAVVLVHGSTVILPSGWSCEREEGALILKDVMQIYQSLGGAFHPARTAIFARRLMAIAEEMGEVLARLARSMSIRERRDFSCAVFDKNGNLLANAPHVPVHLGSMGQTVRSLLKRKGDVLSDGQAWLSNDPYNGGSHLPDITVVMPVFENGELLALVASRGHHIDVGGTHPGSMPPRARHIKEEGMLWPHQLCFDGQTWQEVDVSKSREPVDVVADLESQVSACLLGVRKVAALNVSLGTGVMTAQMSHVRAHAKRVCLNWMRDKSGTYEAIETIKDNLLVTVRLEISPHIGNLIVSAPKHDGNLNTPVAVVRACLLYVLRALIAEDIPLNDGTLEPWTIQVNENGLFDPVYPDAVSGGNVESSQHLVDALLRALNEQSSSQGTMNNLCVGTEQGTFYETIGGGAGATASLDGGSAVQVHMTNTKATDVEELEVRFPVRLCRWQIRQNSGGNGRFSGGDGMIKEWLFLAPAHISLLATRRETRGVALEGGEVGKCGVDERDIGNGWEKSPEDWIAKKGDRLRISTPGGSGFGVKSDGQTSDS